MSRGSKGLKGRCSSCGREVRIRNDGRTWKHAGNADCRAGRAPWAKEVKPPSKPMIPHIYSVIFNSAQEVRWVNAALDFVALLILGPLKDSPRGLMEHAVRLGVANNRLNESAEELGVEELLKVRQRVSDLDDVATAQEAGDALSTS